jgi:hypothetical protein
MIKEILDKTIQLLRDTKQDMMKHNKEHLHATKPELFERIDASLIQLELLVESGQTLVDMEELDAIVDRYLNTLNDEQEYSEERYQTRRGLASEWLKDFKIWVRTCRCPNCGSFTVFDGAYTQCTKCDWVLKR